MLVLSGCELHLIFLVSREHGYRLSFLCWCFVGGVTPVLIPNTAVKPSRADGTRKGESRPAPTQSAQLEEAAHTFQSAPLRCRIATCHGLHVVELRM